MSSTSKADGCAGSARRVKAVELTERVKQPLTGRRRDIGLGALGLPGFVFVGLIRLEVVPHNEHGRSAGLQDRTAAQRGRVVPAE